MHASRTASYGFEALTDLRDTVDNEGFRQVVAGPYVRSSYHADDMVPTREGIPASADHGA